MTELPQTLPNGLLPEGLCDLTLEQVRSLFGQFQHSDRRCRLFEKLTRYVREVGQAGWGAKIVIDGSFVMSCVDAPEDVDLVLVLPTDWDIAAELRPHEYNVISKRMVRRLYGFDVFAVRAGSEEERRWLEFFAQVNVKWSNPPCRLPTGARKGLVRISP